MTWIRAASAVSCVTGAEVAVGGDVGRTARSRASKLSLMAGTLWRRGRGASSLLELLSCRLVRCCGGDAGGCHSEPLLMWSSD